MGRTSGPVDALREATGSFFQQSSKTPYKIVRTNGKLELRWPGQKQELSFFIGSGRMGRSYAFLDRGYLYESPAGYYSTRRAWDAAPGYQHDKTPDLSRPITPECLFCHASGARAVPGTLNKIADTAALHGIGCGRCHGDGAEHTLHPLAGNIVNPARLSARLRDSVCDQCHLAGEVRLSLPAAKLDKFQPGADLSDFIQVFVNAGASQGVRVNGHADALAKSRCRIASGGKLWCGSCHDPHAATADFRQRCLQCHQAADCPSASKHSGDCIGCHMPKARAIDGGHTVFTDHSIRKRPVPESDAKKAKEIRPYFNNQLANGVDHRNLGLAYAELGNVEKAWPLLRAAIDAGVRDPVLYARIAGLLQADGRQEQAEAYYRQALSMDADQFDAVTGLAGLLALTGGRGEAEMLRRKAAMLSPRQAQANR